MNINPSENPPESPFRLFVSYAHKGEMRKDRLLTALAPYKRIGLIETWNDREIDAGDDWEAEINEAMENAHAAIFILDEYFLASSFCLDNEVGYFLQRHRNEGALILFVFADYCGWKAFDFISKFQIVPGDDKPVVAFRPHSKAYTDVAEKIEQALRKHRKEHGLPQRAALSPTVASTQPATYSLAALLAKLPGATTHLFGRENELEQINSWKDHKGVFLWVADGGWGKSALVRWWLEQQDWPAGTHFFGHSFYSQGSHNQATSSRSFLLDALKQLRVQHEINAADDELGRLLAETIAQAPTVLVLDGIEPLQQLSKDEKLNGMVKDRGLAALLEGLARKPGQALCLASSRLPIPDAAIADGNYFKEKTLGLLPPDGALKLLRQRGVRGDDDELGAMTERCGYHPLALVLAAEFCHTFLQDRAAEFLQRAWQLKPGEKHAATIMAWFDSALAEEHQALDRELARILGLFDRPAPWGALLALKQVAPIHSLTAALHDADEASIMESLARLSQWGLLNADLTQREPELDAHPLVREHFGALLEQDEPQAWQSAHSVLFDWFQKLPTKWQPDTLEELEPLYRAVGHGCKAGRYLTVLDKVYRQRIHRNDGYGLFHLGSFSTDLVALANFFPQGWDQPPLVDTVLPGEHLDELARTWLLSVVAPNLAALTRLEEALVVRRREQQVWRVTKSWSNLSNSSVGVAELLIPLGRWKEAETASREALGAAAYITDKTQRWTCTMAALTHLGRTLHSQGRLNEALLSFKQAESILVRNEPKTPHLYGIPSYHYAQLLLERTSKKRCWRDVLERGRAALKIDKRLKRLNALALDHCTIGQASSILGKPEAKESMEQAVATMQRAGSGDDQPAMHLVRADYQRSLPNFPDAWADHEAAHAIASRGNMRTYLAECALLAGNLCLDEALVPKAAAQYATAAQLIHEDSYGRRYTELHLLHARLLHAQHDPAAPQALEEAQARIREAGQWYFWRELRAVANEIGTADPGECP